MKFNSISEIEVGDYVTLGNGKKIIEVTELHATYTNWIRGVYVESGKVIKDHYSYFAPAPEQNTHTYDEDDMRAAYDKGMEDRLEQVIDWFKSQQDYLSTFIYLPPDIDCKSIERSLRKAMRPAQEDYVYDTDLKTYKELDSEVVDRLIQQMRPTTQDN